MRDTEIVGLWEAYLQVHQPKEEVEQLDEDFPKQVGDFLKRGGDELRKRLPGVAAALTTGKGGTVTAAQQKEKIKPVRVGEEVENWVNSLIDEGYDLSEYTWEDMYEMYVNLDEGYDTFDAILEHLVAEGYADTNESALAIMANMSEEWREGILDEAVRGSGRSIGDRITGNDIRGVTRKGKTVYKKPQWKDDVENKVDREFPSTRRTQTSNTYDGGRDSNTIKANKKSINRMNAAKNIEVKQADGDYENSIDHSKPGKGKSGYMEVPTDYRARNRRARGR